MHERERTETEREYESEGRERDSMNQRKPEKHRPGLREKTELR